MPHCNRPGRAVLSANRPRPCRTGGDNGSMCANYVPVTRRDRLLSFFGVERDRDDPPADTWPVGVAPFIRLAESASGPERVVADGLFGLLPHFATEVAYGR